MNKKLNTTTTFDSKAAQQAALDNLHISGPAISLSIILFTLSFLGSIFMAEWAGDWTALYAIVTMLAAFYVLFAFKVAKQWEKAVVLRLGRFHGLRGPGMFWLLPVIDSTPLVFPWKEFSA